MSTMKACGRERVYSILALASILAFSHCISQTATEVRPDFQKYFDEYKVEGCFVLYNMRQDKYILYNEKERDRPFIPASTFKICNSLIGVETGVIPDERFVLKWDGIVRWRPEWNQDHDMRAAFRNSTVWYYQELARRVGGQRMKFWLDKAAYGNSDTSGGIDRFWLSGGLRISPQEQIDFLRRLYSGTLPFSQRTTEIVKRVMIMEDTLGHTLRAKTGLSDQEGMSVGWYVGYLESTENVYFFASCIHCDDKNNPDFVRGRVEAARKILRELKVL